jgi:hypothetical protein
LSVSISPLSRIPPAVSPLSAAEHIHHDAR